MANNTEWDKLESFDPRVIEENKVTSINYAQNVRTRFIPGDTQCYWEVDGLPVLWLRSKNQHVCLTDEEMRKIASICRSFVNEDETSLSSEPDTHSIAV